MNKTNPQIITCEKLEYFITKTELKFMTPFTSWSGPFNKKTIAGKFYLGVFLEYFL